MSHPVRRQNRLPSFDYSAKGIYFITICTQDRKNWFWQSETNTGLTNCGLFAASAAEEIAQHYPDVYVDAFAILPDHVHMLLRIGEKNQKTVSTIVNQYKGFVTKQCGCPIWQKGFYDHVVRDEKDYMIRWKYIEDNPVRWMEKHVPQTSLNTTGAQCAPLR